MSWLPAWFALAVPAGCATLTIQSQTIAPGQSAIAAVSFSATGQAVSAVQFDLECDPGLTVRLLPGTQVAASGKTLYATFLPGGSLRIVVAGLNQATLGDGQLLRPLVRVEQQAATGAAEIRMRNPMATSADGVPVDIEAASALISIRPDAASATPPLGVFNAASLLPGPVSPGEIVTILGGPDLTWTSAVLFNGLSAPILYAGVGQVNAVVPMALPAGDTVTLQIMTIAPQEYIPMAVAPASPAIFTSGSAGAGPGAILNEDYTLNSPSNGAVAGSVIAVYGTGFGLLSTAMTDGQIVTGAVPTALPVSATIGGVRAEVSYAGSAPGLIAGVIQINVRIPEGLPSNSEAPLSISAGPYTTSTGVTVSIR